MSKPKSPFMHALLRVVAALMGTMSLMSLLLFVAGRNPIDTLEALFRGGFGSQFGLIEATVRMIPILLCALAASIPAKGGLFNIGGEGQLYSGAIAGTAVALYVEPGSVFARLPIVICAAMAAGAIWALVPAVLRIWLNVSEILVALMLNYVAAYVLEYLVHGPWKDAHAMGWPYTAPFPSWAVFPKFHDTNVHVGLLFGCLAAGIAYFIFRFTVWGFSIRILGANPLAAKYAGVSIRASMIALMAIGGSIAAVAGIGEASVIQGRLRPGLSPGFGFTGFLVAWLAHNRPLVLLPAAFVVGGLYSGADALQLSAGLPSATIDIFMGLTFLCFLIFDRFRSPANGVKEYTAS